MNLESLKAQIEEILKGKNLCYPAGYPDREPHLRIVLTSEGWRVILQREAPGNAYCRQSNEAFIAIGFESDEIDYINERREVYYHDRYDKKWGLAEDYEDDEWDAMMENHAEFGDLKAALDAKLEADESAERVRLWSGTWAEDAFDAIVNVDFEDEQEALS